MEKQGRQGVKGTSDIRKKEREGGAGGMKKQFV
jgi:hypothetical protein